MIEAIKQELSKNSDPEQASVLQRFFKTGAGEYGEGDLFRGIRVPVLRKLAKAYAAVALADTEHLLSSPFHEDRMVALLILVRIFSKADAATKREIYDLYLRRTSRINNWDLVDLSAEHIVGAYLLDKDKEPLSRLALSDSLWERRIAILSTFHYIKRGEFQETLRLATLLLKDNQDLIHKAVGWMLREIGKRDPATEEAFLATHYKEMPRTMLRYAIERFPEDRRLQYLNGGI